MVQLRIARERVPRSGWGDVPFYGGPQRALPLGMIPPEAERGSTSSQPLRRQLTEQVVGSVITLGASVLVTVAVVVIIRILG